MKDENHQVETTSLPISCLHLNFLFLVFSCCRGKSPPPFKGCTLHLCFGALAFFGGIFALVSSLCTSIIINLFLFNGSFLFSFKHTQVSLIKKKFYLVLCPYPSPAMMLSLPSFLPRLVESVAYYFLSS